MKIPYFYLEAGRHMFFQPQNKPRGREENIFDEEGIEILIRFEPELDGGTLYLNGRNENKNFNILELQGTNLHINVLRDINQRGNNV